MNNWYNFNNHTLSNLKQRTVDKYVL